MFTISEGSTSSQHPQHLDPNAQLVGTVWDYHASPEIILRRVVTACKATPEVSMRTVTLTCCERPDDSFALPALALGLLYRYVGCVPIDIDDLQAALAAAEVL